MLLTIGILKPIAEKKKNPCRAASLTNTFMRMSEIWIFKMFHFPPGINYLIKFIKPFQEN